MFNINLMIKEALLVIDRITHLDITTVGTQHLLYVTSYQVSSKPKQYIAHIIRPIKKRVLLNKYIYTLLASRHFPNDTITQP